MARRLVLNFPYSDFGDPFPHPTHRAAGPLDTCSWLHMFDPVLTHN